MALRLFGIPPISGNASTAPKGERNDEPHSSVGDMTMMIRLVLGFAALVYIAITQPASLQSGRVGDELAQSTPISPTVLAVVRNRGATLHDRPNGEPLQNIVGGSLVTARLRSTDLQWVLVQTRDQSEGWVEVRTLLAAGLGRLPIEQPTPTPTLTPTITPTPSPSPSTTPTSEVVTPEAVEATGDGYERAHSYGRDDGNARGYGHAGGNG